MGQLIIQQHQLDAQVGGQLKSGSTVALARLTSLVKVGQSVCAGDRSSRVELTGRWFARVDSELQLATKTTKTKRGKLNSILTL